MWAEGLLEPLGESEFDVGHSLVSRQPQRPPGLSHQPDSGLVAQVRGSFQSYRDFYRICLLRGSIYVPGTASPGRGLIYTTLASFGEISMNTKLALSVIVAALMLTACAKQEAASTDTAATPPAPAAPAAAPAAPADQAAPAAGTTAAPAAGEAAAPAAGATPPAEGTAKPAEEPKK
jgi:hypothetical protein